MSVSSKPTSRHMRGPLPVLHDAIVDASLHVRLPFLLHLYVLPFAALAYPAWSYIYLFHYDAVLGSREFTFLSLVLLLSLNALTFLLGEWSVSFKAFSTCRKTRSPYDENAVVRVIPEENCGSPALCNIQRTTSTENDGAFHSKLFFTYNKECFFYNEDKKCFMPTEYPASLPLACYRSANGLSKTQINAIRPQFGANAFDIPVPTFIDLFREHLIAPFFVFQIFCVGLWALDEYWYYSLFTLFMLVMFESTVVFQRLRTIKEFRTMSQKPYPVYVFRSNTWTLLESTTLILPGDIISVTRAVRDDCLVPCDLILLRGNVIVNEAMLSGESTPLLKESIALRTSTRMQTNDNTYDDNDDYDGDSAILDENLPEDAVHILHGGTKVVQIIPSPASQVTDGVGVSIASSHIPDPPDRGCVAYAIRTGFGTTQGRLVRMMIFSSERASANNAESFMFIGFLLIFAIIAATYVFINAETTPERNTSKLLLHCLLIITSVIPPELPMELSMAVNASLLSLSRSAIFCTEPFRIPFAGKLDFLCFDKTGTITAENLVVEGIAGFDGPTSMNSKRSSPSAWAQLREPLSCPRQTLLVLASAHSLVFIEEENQEQEDSYNSNNNNNDDDDDDDGNGNGNDNDEKDEDESSKFARVKMLKPLKGAGGNGSSVVGDPMERAALDAARFELVATDKVRPIMPEDAGAAEASSGSGLGILPRGAEIHILRKFAFSSTLKRMSTICKITGASGFMFAAVKGAPETIMPMLSSVPARYSETYKHLARNGGRVLALAWKCIDKDGLEGPVENVSRDSIECNLDFAGFLVFSSPLKRESKASIESLSKSSHRCVMITGDNALTACHVAEQVGITSRAALILDAEDGDSNGDDNDCAPRLLWRFTSDDVHSEFSVSKVASLVESYDLCVTGRAFAIIESGSCKQQVCSYERFKSIFCYIYVWARVSPVQKESVLRTLKEQGFYTLMCGDGTNDVGALKQAHVGVALLEYEPEDLLEINLYSQLRQMTNLYEKQCQLALRFGAPAPPAKPGMLIGLEKRWNEMQKLKIKRSGKKPVKKSKKVRMVSEGEQSATNEGEGASKPTAVKKTRAAKAKTKTVAKAKTNVKSTSSVSERSHQPATFDAISSTLLKLNEDEAPTLQLGDASVSAPFTSKVGTVSAVCKIVNEGRCALVTTLQMYRILALNCLISAYSMSVLFLEGVKWGDWQLTIQGVCIALCFFCITRGKPIEELSAQRPQAKLFTIGTIASLLGQFAVHGYTLYYVTAFSKEHMEETLEVDFDGKVKFKPNIMNSGIFLATLSMLVSTFVINYVGRPFRESIMENRALSRGLLVAGAASFLGAAEVLPELNKMMELVEFPAGFAVQLSTAMAIDFALAFLIDRVISAVFLRTAPRRELRIGK